MSENRISLVVSLFPRPVDGDDPVMSVRSRPIPSALRVASLPGDEFDLSSEDDRDIDDEEEAWDDELDDEEDDWDEDELDEDDTEEDVWEDEDDESDIEDWDEFEEDEDDTEEDVWEEDEDEELDEWDYDH